MYTRYNPLYYQVILDQHSPFVLNQMRALLFFVIAATACLLFSSSVFPDHNLGFCSDQHVEMATTLGGLQDSTNPEVESLARFAVEHHNTKENALLELVRVVKAHEQVVSGTLHHLTLEVVDAGNKKLYEAKIWVKPWLNFKEVQEFKHVGDVPCFTSSDLGVKKEESGWKSVPVHDPVVKDAAEHAVKTIQSRSNSLLPYELSEIVHANAEVVDASAKFDILLKVKRGEKEEKFKVEVHRNNEGGFHLNKMDAHHS